MTWRGVAVVMGLGLAGVARPAAPVTIGVVAPGSGADAAAGRELRAGVELALADLRARGVEVEVAWEDDAGDPRQGLAAVARLAARPEVAGVLGASVDEATGAEAKAAERYEVPHLVAAAERDELTRLRYAWTFRLGASAGQQVEALLTAARAQGRPRTIALVAEDTEAGDSLLRCAIAGAKGQRMKVLAAARVAPGGDWGPALAAAAAAGPEAVLLAATRADGAAVLAAARTAGLAGRALLLAGPSFAGGAPGGAWPGGLLRTAPWTPELGGAAGRDLATRLVRGGHPATPGAAFAYAAAVILAEEAARAGGDRALLRAALERGRWDGVAGPVAFAERQGATHQNRPPVAVEQLRDGRYQPVWPRKLARAEPEDRGNRGSGP